jgi:hypothetical protein
MAAYGGHGSKSARVLPYMLMLTIDEWSDSRLDRFNSMYRALGAYWVGKWVDPRSGLAVAVLHSVDIKG